MSRGSSKNITCRNKSITKIGTHLYKLADLPVHRSFTPVTFSLAVRSSVKGTFKSPTGTVQNSLITRYSRGQYNMLWKLGHTQGTCIAFIFRRLDAERAKRHRPVTVASVGPAYSGAYSGGHTHSTARERFPCAAGFAPPSGFMTKSVNRTICEWNFPNRVSWGVFVTFSS